MRSPPHQCPLCDEDETCPGAHELVDVLYPKDFWAALTPEVSWALIEAIPKKLLGPWTPMSPGSLLFGRYDSRGELGVRFDASLDSWTVFRLGYVHPDGYTSVGGYGTIYEADAKAREEGYTLVQREKRPQ